MQRLMTAFAAMILAFGVFSIGTVPVGADDFENAECYTGYDGCPNDGECLAYSGQCRDEGGNWVDYNKYRSTTFTVGGCSWMTGHFCRENPKTACITTYYMGPGNCDISQMVCSIANPGKDCTTP